MRLMLCEPHFNLDRASHLSTTLNPVSPLHTRSLSSHAFTHTRLLHTCSSNTCYSLHVRSLSSHGLCRTRLPRRWDGRRHRRSSLRSSRRTRCCWRSAAAHRKSWTRSPQRWQSLSARRRSQRWTRQVSGQSWSRCAHLCLCVCAGPGLWGVPDAACMLIVLGKVWK